MIKKYGGREFDLYADKKGDIIYENDIMLFDNQHYYQCVVSNNRYCLKCLSIDLPLIWLDKICIGKELASASIIKKFNIL